MSLTIENFSYRYNKKCRPVLENVSHSFEKGRFYGIFGLNGSGKSTLLKALSGEIASGTSVKLDDKIISKLKVLDRARLLAFAAQSDEFTLPFTARECIKLGRYAWGDEGTELIGSLLADWNCQSLAERKFAELSGGEQQRIKLLRILAQDTPYILLDEPAASLDWPRQLELYEKLRDLAHRQNRCVIMVAHDLYAAPGFVDQMLIMHEGVLRYAGSADAPEASEAIKQTFSNKYLLTRTDGQLIINFQAR